MSEDYKQKAMTKVEEVAKKVAKTKNKPIDEKTVLRLRNLTLDQINVVISSKVKSKVLWVFDSEDFLPTSVQGTENNPMQMGLFSGTTLEKDYYRLKSNSTWEKTKDSSDLSKQEFEEKVLDMLLEDFETAAFYGALSYFSGDRYE